MIKVQLVVVQGRPEGKTIPLTGSVFRIGRDESCQLRPSSEEVSRRHAEIVVGPDSVTVKDLGSRNGTILNGKPVKEATPLKTGDLIKVGPLTFAVSIQGAAAAVATAPGVSGSPTPASLDEVSPQEVESWLIADNEHAVPERPSGVYDGDTMMMDAFQAKKPEPQSRPAAAPAPAAPPPAASAPAPAPTPPPAAVPEPPPAPAPTPEPVVTQAPTSESPVISAPPPAAVPVVETPTPAPVAEAPPPAAPAPPAPKPVPPSQVTAAPPRSIWDELENIEFLPEGEGDSEQSSYSFESDASEGESGSGESGAQPEEMPEEWIDESNPFYAAKKKAQESTPAEAAKPAFKDTSEAAGAIIKKLMERRKGGG